MVYRQVAVIHSYFGVSISAFYVELNSGLNLNIHFIILDFHLLHIYFHGNLLSYSEEKKIV